MKGRNIVDSNKLTKKAQKTIMYNGMGGKGLNDGH